ncbi:hypothetical protein EMPS_02677 [Entomortierella parvispora]|uniref:Arrestin-like N-terminal domain-containing protein n=1 Tax=Entomortierella parvispora TaxID=205924 RepID=A0A9P3LTT1_9FUNG|nr:hypothetical protein EMPS_02677 [Entomortierella parvispora]
MRAQKQDPSKQKSLTIHIDTDHVGPHGMPLVYGSTPESIGAIKGTVRFASNYDCKGRDIQIIYEAWIESHWTVQENKKTVRHQSKEVFGYQTWAFPLVHTKPNGSIVAAGNYEQSFEVPLLHPADRIRSSMDSTSSTSSSPASSNLSSLAASASASSSSLPILVSNSTLTSSTASPTTSTSSARSTATPVISSAALALTSTFTGKISLLPSSSYSPHAKIKYTIRAVLQRSFPSLSNVEASQEVWVLHTSPPTSASTTPNQQSLSPSPSLTTLRAPATPVTTTLPIKHSPRVSSLPSQASTTTTPSSVQKSKRKEPLPQVSFKNEAITTTKTESQVPVASSQHTAHLPSTKLIPMPSTPFQGSGSKQVSSTFFFYLEYMHAHAQREKETRGERKSF